MPAAVDGRAPRSAHRRDRGEHGGPERDEPTAGGAGAVVEPTGPMECQELMALDFRAHYFPAFAHLPSYTEWLLDADLTSTYRYERRALKLLQWGEPVRRPWRLKCPSHLLWLDDLDAVFPDARFVMTHRDPTDVMVSVADVYHEVGKAVQRRSRPALPRSPQRRAVGDGHGRGCSSSAMPGATIASSTSTSVPCRPTRSVRSAGSTTGSASR